MHASTDDLDGRFERIRELLLSPSAENVARVADYLESLAGDVSQAVVSLHSEVTGSDTSLGFLSIVRQKTPRVAALLHNAARCYNGLGVGSSVGYERHGLICPIQTTGRALARL